MYVCVFMLVTERSKDWVKVLITKPAQSKEPHGGHGVFTDKDCKLARAGSSITFKPSCSLCFVCSGLTPRSSKPFMPVSDTFADFRRRSTLSWGTSIKLFNYPKNACF